ncbi:MAG: ATP phosphoribosyltransferase [Phycisphaerales bacterium]
MTTNQTLPMPTDQPSTQYLSESEDPKSTTIKFAIPKGRMYDGVSQLLKEAGIKIGSTARDYRPSISLPDMSVKILKPRAIVEMLDLGSRDLGFAGADWVSEDNADLVELLDTGLDRVRLVAAAPNALVPDGKLPKRAPKDSPLLIASEYVNITQRWINEQNMNAKLIRSYGATEVLPPEDADCIVDNTATGSTLSANNLKIVDDLMVSTTRIYASKQAMDDPRKRERINQFVLLVSSVLEARNRVMLELNVSGADLDAVINILPSMRMPTVSPMHGCDGFAVKAAVLKEQIPAVIPAIKSVGGTDIVVTKPSQIVQ